MLPSTFCTNVPLVLSCSGSLTPQGRSTTGCITPLPVVPSLYVVRGGRPEGVISELNGWPTLPLSTLHVRSHDRPRMTRGHNGAAPPFMWGTFTPCSMPVYPGAFTTSPECLLYPFNTLCHRVDVDGISAIISWFGSDQDKSLKFNWICSKSTCF